MMKALEGTYRDVFVPAASKQAGFSEATLLRAISSEAHSHRACNRIGKRRITKTIYNALQVRAQNKAGQSLSMLVAYTYERNISDSTVSALRTSIT
jgi:hypothetical protein